MQINLSKILMIVAFKNFRDEEFVIPFNEFTKAGAEVIVSSTELGMAEGVMGHKTKVDILLSKVKAENYHAIVFVGGKGTPTVRSHKAAIELATSAASDDKKILSAICWAPTILAKAGVLKNKKATVWLGVDDEYGKNTDEVLAQYGAQFVNKDVITDGRIITANGAPAALSFAQEILKKLREI